ncbi:MAG: choice-of-anchor tandem repeat NxxGxxAF-containing protein [Tahibacter sp.]
MVRTLFILLSIPLGMSAAVAATLPTYDAVQLQVRTNLLVNDNGWNLPPGSSFNSITPAINSRTHIALPVQVVPNGGSSNPGVWSGENGTGGIVYNGPVDASISSAVSINALGTVVFTLSDTGSADGIYSYDPVLHNTARVGTAPLFPSSYSNVQINTAGEIGFQGTFSAGRAWASRSAGIVAMHVGDVGLIPESPYTYLYSPSFNDLRQIAGKVATSPDLVSSTQIRRFAADGSSVRLAANRGTDANSPIKQFDNSLALASDGSVAFVATRQLDNRRVVYRTDGVSLTEIAVVDPVGTIRGIEFFPPGMNSVGQVVFRALDAGGQAIYVGDGANLVRVVGKNDLLMTDLGTGQVGQDNESDAVFGGAPAINERGDVAFVAALRPPGQPTVEWGSGVFVAYANNRIFANGFD